MNKTYECKARKFTTTKNDREITEVFGDHLEGKTNDDVKSFYVEFATLKYLPTNLGSFFPNLEHLNIFASRLRELTTDDLDGLEKLKTLGIFGNRIKRIPKDFFKKTPEIHHIDFSYNKILTYDPNMFDQLPELDYVNFLKNLCIDKVVDPLLSSASVDDLKNSMKNLCHPSTE